MIYTIVARNPKNELLEMVLERPEQSGINVLNVTGVTPIGAEIYITPFASIDGGIFAGSRVPSRNVVMTLGMYQKDLGNGKLGSIEDSRRILYNFFRIKDPVNLVFYTDTRISQIIGYVESCEVDIFSDHEEATVSIVCVSPWFKSEGITKVGFSGVRALFEFPFESKQGSTKPENLLEFGSISIDTRTDLFYSGDIKIGFELEISFQSDEFHNIYLYNMDTRERLILYTDLVEQITGYKLDKGDEIHISTVSGSKTAYLLRDGIFTNVIQMVDKDSNWFQLTKGNNVFAFASDYGVENIVIKMVYQDTYGGI